ncbi:MAG: HAD-IB family hydrolase [Dehalococcoidia bacterium]
MTTGIMAEGVPVELRSRNMPFGLPCSAGWVPVSDYWAIFYMTMRSGQENDQRQTLAVFDLDGTLTYCDTLLPFLRHAAGRAVFWVKMPSLVPVLVAFRLGLKERTAAKEAVLRRFIGGWPVEEVEAAAVSFAIRVLPRLCNREALDRLRWHLGKGHRVCIASASLEMYVRGWAADVGVADVAATRLESVGGRVTGRLDGANCYGPEKLVRLRQRIGEVEGLSLHVYGDSAGDRALLDAAQHQHYKPFRQRWHRLQAIVTLLRALL